MPLQAFFNRDSKTDVSGWIYWRSGTENPKFWRKGVELVLPAAAMEPAIALPGQRSQVLSPGWRRMWWVFSFDLNSKITYFQRPPLTYGFKPRPPIDALIDLVVKVRNGSWTKQLGWTEHRIRSAISILNRPISNSFRIFKLLDYSVDCGTGNVKRQRYRCLRMTARALQSTKTLPDPYRLWRWVRASHRVKWRGTQHRDKEKLTCKLINIDC